MAGRCRGWPAWREQNLDYACRIFPAKLSGRGFDSPHLHQQRADGGHSAAVHRVRRRPRPADAAAHARRGTHRSSASPGAVLSGDSEHCRGRPLVLPAPHPLAETAQPWRKTPPYHHGSSGPTRSYRGAGKAASRECPQSTTPERTHPGTGMVQYCQLGQTLIPGRDGPSGYETTPENPPPDSPYHERRSQPGDRPGHGCAQRPNSVSTYALRHSERWEWRQGGSPYGEAQSDSRRRSCRFGTAGGAAVLAPTDQYRGHR